MRHFWKHFRNYGATIASRTGLNAFWSIDGSIAVINGIKKIRSVNHLITADFSTLYTSLPHDVILENIFELIDLLFKNSGKQLLAVIQGRERKCWFTNEKPAKGMALNSIEIKQLAWEVVTNSFVKFAGLVFKQENGIPMGTNCSPLIADLTLANMEFKFMNKPVNNDVRYKLKHTFRYMDDLLSINCPEFMEVCSRIYPVQLPLSKTSDQPTKCAYLDIDLEIIDKNVVSKVYNKTDDFNFAVVRYVECESNTATSVGLNTFYSQLVRIARINSDLEGFKDRVTEMYYAFRRKNYNDRQLNRRFWNFTRDYRPLLFKFKIVTKKDICDFIISICQN